MKNDFKYLKIYRELRNAITEKTYPYGTKLPSKRSLSDSRNVSVITIEKACSLLEEEGYIEARERSGYYVTYREKDSFLSFPENEITENSSSKYVLPENLFPFSQYAKAVRKVLNESGSLLFVKSPNTGTEELKSAISSYLLRSKNISVDSSQIIIGSGAEYLYGIILLLLGKNHRFAIEKPSYNQIKNVYEAYDADFEELSLGPDGILSSALEKTKASILHVSPYNSFPSGITTSASKRNEYISWASVKGRYIIEDDFASEFSLSRRNEDTLYLLSGSDNVIYINSFSMTVSPSMRIGYMLIPDSLSRLYEEKLGSLSCPVPLLDQMVLREILNSGEFERHINRVRRALRK